MLLLFNVVALAIELLIVILALVGLFGRVVFATVDRVREAGDRVEYRSSAARAAPARRARGRSSGRLSPRATGEDWMIDVVVCP